MVSRLRRLLTAFLVITLLILGPASAASTAAPDPIFSYSQTNTITTIQRLYGNLFQKIWNKLTVPVIFGRLSTESDCAAEEELAALPESDSGIRVELIGRADEESLAATAEEIDMLARITYAEARGERFEGQIAVAAVVLNRLQDQRFPDTIYEVILQPGQFSAVGDGQYTLQPDAEIYKAVEVALKGNDPTNGALFYYNPKLSKDSWIRTRSIVKDIGNHRFCL